MDYYVGRALAKSTQRTYRSAEKRYVAFCTMHHISPLPVDEKTLCRYVASLASDGLRHGSIKGYLAAIRQVSIQQDEGDPHISNMAKLELVLHGIKRVQALSQTAPTRQPITIELLDKLRGSWLAGTPTWDERMLWAAASVCFFGFFRSGEITVPGDQSFDESCHLTAADVTIDSHRNPSMLRIRLKASKTDPFRVGVDVFVGWTGSPICPVTAMLEYVLIRGTRAGPLFLFKDGKLLTRSRFVERVRVALDKAGVDSRPFSGHSFRSGAATTAAKRGLGDSTIKLLGRWKSNAYQLYIKTPREHLAAATRTLAQGR